MAWVEGAARSHRGALAGGGLTQLARLASGVLGSVREAAGGSPRGVANRLVDFVEEKARLLDLAALLLDAAGFQRTAILTAAARVGLFDHLEQHGAATVQQAARELALDGIALERLLGALTRMGYVKRTERAGMDAYENTRRGALCARTPRPGAGRTYLDMVEHTWEGWRRLETTLRTGQPSEQMGLFGGSREALYHYYTVANELAVEPCRELVSVLPLAQVRRAIIGEVGLTFMRELLQRQPEVEYAVAGLPGQVDFLEALLARYPPARAPAEVITAAPDGEPTASRWGSREAYDLVFLYRKLAYAGYGGAFLRKAFSVLNPGGLVIVFEPMTDALALSRSFVSELQMMDLLIGGAAAPPLLSSEEISAMLRQVGFCRVSTVPVLGGAALFVVGYKP